MNELVNEWVSELHEWIQTNKRMKMNRWMKKQIWMEAWMNKWKKDGRKKDTECLVNEWLNDQMYEYNVWMNDQMYEYNVWMNDQIYRMN